VYGRQADRSYRHYNDNFKLATQSKCQNRKVNKIYIKLYRNFRIKCAKESQFYIQKTTLQESVYYKGSIAFKTKLEPAAKKDLKHNFPLRLLHCHNIDTHLDQYSSM